MQVPAPFEYERATSIDHAIALMERLGSEARIVAGGHSLLPMMKLRLATPEYLIDINDLSPELEYIRIDASEVRIGALTRHRHLLESDELAAVLPIFRDAEKVIADPVVRNRGTLGGSLCQADPSEDLSAVCDTVEAQCVIRSGSGERVVEMRDFHQGPYETAVGDGEMLTEIRIPLRPNSSSAYHKVERRAGDWAVASAGAAVTMDGATIADGRVGLCAVGPNLTNIGPISDALRGQSPSEDLYAQVGQIAADNASPTADTRGTVAYKTHLAKELTIRSLRTAVARATGASEGN
jgi:carbon-monoxide dehydrogenase medium subunit